MRIAIVSLAFTLCVPLLSSAQEGEPGQGTLVIRLIRAEGKAPLVDTLAAVSIGRMEGGPEKILFDPGAGRTDEEGRMKVAYPPGVLQVQVHVKGYAYAVSQAFKLADKAEHRLEFLLVPGCRITGQVIGKTLHLPLDEAKVSLMTATHSANVQRTEADGIFEFADAPPGQHRIRIEHPDHPHREIDFEVQAGQVFDLGQTPLEPPEFGRVALEVYLPDQPAPLRDYDVVVAWEKDGRPEGFPGAVRGIDTFVVKVPVGHCTLQVEKPGFRPAIVAVLVPRGILVPVKVRLKPEEKR